MTRGVVDSAPPLTPYLARLVVEWLHDMPEVSYRSINGTAVFADISGFTNLTEKLARRGKAGAEEMGDVLNLIFEQLLAAAYEYGAGLVKWGGDAVLLLFDSDRHAEMACRAASEMQRVIGRIGRVRTTSGAVRLRMSIGVHSGDLDFLLVGSHFRELLITGPGATAVAQMEKIADAGEIVVSPATAARLADAGAPPLGDAKGSGVLLAAAPVVPRAPSRAPVRDVDLTNAFDATLRDHLLEGRVEPEHRNVTVSFIQVQGADELLARDGPEALTAAISHFIDACQDAVAANDVTLLSSDICEDGAKVIIISGAPKSAGDDEARVLTAARNVIDAAGVLPVKAGVNSGRVFAGDFGPSYRRVYSVVGDSVNLAARLMGKAEPGQIIATPAVLERSRTAFETTPLPPFQVKGKSAPIDASLVGSIIRDQAPSAKIEMPLIGRDNELAALLDAAAQAARGEGRVVELVGPPGVGKSRLLAELVAKTDASVLWADGDIYASATPYQPLHRLFRHQLGVAEGTSPKKMGALLRRLVAGADSSLLPWLPLIGIVAGVDLPMTPEIERIDPDVRKERLEQVTSETLGRLLTTPTIFIFNDLQFMDGATVDLFKRLVDDSGDRPWLLIATRRPDSGTSVRSDSSDLRIELEPLDAAAAAQFIALATSDSPLPVHRMQALIDRASGNPLFLKELVARATDVDEDDALPDSIEGVVAVRIDRLPRERRLLLRAASVLGMTVELDLLKAVLSAEDAADANAFAGWDGLSEFVVPTDEGHVRFAHHLIRETAYEGLPFRRRTVLHARAADVIEQRAGPRVGEYAELLSLHSFRGERYHGAWEYSRLAGDQARRRYANADAADCYRRAVASARHISSIAVADVADVCEELGDVYLDLGEFDASERFLQQARQRTGGDRSRGARLHLKTAAQRQLIGRYPDALRWLSRGRRLVEERDDQESLALRAQLAELYAAIRYAQGRHREAITWAQRSIAEARAGGDRHTQAKALEIQNAAAAVTGQEVDETSGREALELYAELGDLRGLARAHNVLGMCAYFVGRWDDALAHYVASEETYMKIGRRFDAAIASANQAEILLEQRRYDEAEAVLQGAMREWRATKALNEIPFGNYLLGSIAARTGRFAEAMELFAGSRRDYLALGESHEVLMIDALTAECHLRAGEPERALDLATRTLTAVRQMDGVDNTVPLLERVRGAALVALGRTQSGFESLRASLAAACHRDAGHEVATTLGALLSAGAQASEEEAEYWMHERATIVATLGIMEPQLSLSD